MTTQPQVWIVIGSTGEFDYLEWCSRAFLTEEDAKDFVAFLQRERQKLPRGDGWETRHAAAAAMAVFDPRYCEDYTGVSWHIESVPLGLVVAPAARQLGRTPE